MAKKWQTFWQVSAIIMLVGVTVAGTLLVLVDQGTPTQAVVATTTPLPRIFVHPGLAQTSANVHLGLVFNSYVNPVSQEQGHIDLVWGAVQPHTPPGVFNIAYNPSDRIGNAASNGLPLYPLSWFQANHPDWIAYQCDKTTPALEFGEPNTPLDITNPAVLDFLIQQEYIPQITQGYDGIGFDNVTFRSAWGRCGHFDHHNHWVAQFTGQENDPAFQQAVITRSAIIYEKLHAYKPTISIAINFPYDFKYPELSDQLMNNIDILIDERSFTNSGTPNDRYLVDAVWQKLMTVYAQFQARNGALFLINEVPIGPVTHDQMQWVLANYLMTRASYTFTTVVGRQEYGKILDHPEYHIPIGTAQGAMTTDQCVFQRQFSNALAIVNPSSSLTCDVTLPPHTYRDLYGVPMTTLHLKSHSGIVLVKG